MIHFTEGGYTLLEENNRVLHVLDTMTHRITRIGDPASLEYKAGEHVQIRRAKSDQTTIQDNITGRTCMVQLRAPYDVLQLKHVDNDPIAWAEPYEPPVARLISDIYIDINLAEDKRLMMSPLKVGMTGGKPAPATPDRRQSLRIAALRTPKPDRLMTPRNTGSATSRGTPPPQMPGLGTPLPKSLDFANKTTRLDKSANDIVDVGREDDIKSYPDCVARHLNGDIYIKGRHSTAIISSASSMRLYDAYVHCTSKILMARINNKTNDWVLHSPYECYCRSMYPGGDLEKYIEFDSNKTIDPAESITFANTVTHDVIGLFLRETTYNAAVFNDAHMCILGRSASVTTDNEANELIDYADKMHAHLKTLFDDTGYELLHYVNLTGENRKPPIHPLPGMVACVMHSNVLVNVLITSIDGTNATYAYVDEDGHIKTDAKPIKTDAKPTASNFFHHIAQFIKSDQATSRSDQVTSRLSLFYRQCLWDQYSLMITLDRIKQFDRTLLTDIAAEDIPMTLHLRVPACFCTMDALTNTGTLLVVHSSWVQSILVSDKNAKDKLAAVFPSNEVKILV